MSHSQDSQQLPNAVTYFGMRDCVVELSLIALALSAPDTDEFSSSDVRAADRAEEGSGINATQSSTANNVWATARACEQRDRLKSFIEACKDRFSDEIDLRGVFTRAAVTQYFRFRNGGVDRLPAMKISDDLAALEKDLYLNTRNKGIVHDVNHCFASYIFAPKIATAPPQTDSDAATNVAPVDNWDANVFEISHASTEYLSILSDLAIYSANHFLKENPVMAYSIGKHFNQRFETRARFYNYDGERNDHWVVSYPQGHRRITLEHLQGAKQYGVGPEDVERTYKTLLTANANLYDLRRAIAALEAILSLDEDAMVTASTEGLLFCALSCEFFNGIYRAVGTNARLNSVTKINTTDKEIVKAYELLKDARERAMHSRFDGPLSCSVSPSSSSPSSPPRNRDKTHHVDASSLSNDSAFVADTMTTTAKSDATSGAAPHLIEKWWPAGKRYQTIRRIVDVIENLVVGTEEQYSKAKEYLLANVDSKALAEVMARRPAPLQTTLFFKDEGKAHSKEMWSPPEEAYPSAESFCLF